MLKKVIFVSGTSYSGSTLLDMILANDPKGFSCGQVYNLFRPIRPYQVNPLCGCGNPDCQVWRQIYRNGPRGLYSSVSKLFPDVEFLVDSSKDPCWVASQERRARKQGIEVLHVLTWKSPEGLARSFAKRGRIDRYVETYVNYHQTYNTLITNWVGVQHELLIADPMVLAKLCDRLKLSMFEEKPKFWEKRHHTLFGNDSAKISLYSRDHPRFEAIKKQRTQIEGELTTPVAEHRSIYRQPQDQASVMDSFDGQTRRALEGIAFGLASRSVGSAELRDLEADGLGSVSRLSCNLRCARDAVRRSIAKLRYRQYFDSSARKL